jgi:hypothetical protein
MASLASVPLTQSISQACPLSHFSAFYFLSGLYVYSIPADEPPAPAIGRCNVHWFHCCAVRPVNVHACPYRCRCAGGGPPSSTDPSCPATFDKCGGSRFDGTPGCCQPGNYCYWKSEYYAQCRPRAPQTRNWVLCTKLTVLFILTEPCYSASCTGLQQLRTRRNREPLTASCHLLQRSAAWLRCTGRFGQHNACLERFAPATHCFAV